MVKGAGVTSRVWPSGGDLATMSVPITVLPPGRLSTTTGWPHISLSFCATMRPTMSVLPPAAKGTTSLTALTG
jgi:hypothetical protein